MANAPLFRRKIGHWAGVGLLLLAGCEGQRVDPGGLPLEAPEPTATRELAEQLDAVLTATAERRLNLQEHAAWQILHGALAFGREFRVERTPSGEKISAVDHLLAGGPIQGWTTEAGVVLEQETDRRGLRALVEAGSKTGQGHHDQWFAVLAQCGLEPDQEIQVGSRRYQMSDLVAQVQWDAPRNLEREFSWTLIGLTSYLPTDASWRASDGETWSIERLVQSELEQDLHQSACGGTHRLIGLAMALNHHLTQGGQLTGVWAVADELIQDGIETAQRFQNEDGSFSSNYFQRPGRSPDLGQVLGTTGHVVEFLALAASDDQLRAPWVERAVVHLCDVFQKTRDLPLECGALYHAAHGLVLYRERLSK